MFSQPSPMPVNMRQITTTPQRISPAIEALARELVREPQLQFLPVTPARKAEIADCFAVVERQVQEHGGSISYGWQIWEWPGVMIEAEFHAVWKDPEGKLRDVTPKHIPVQQILFLLDPVRQYAGFQVNNVRRALRADPCVDAFIKACDEEYQLLNKGERAYEHGEIHLSETDEDEFLRIQKKKAEAALGIRAATPRLGRNDACYCGSGKKFKKCCGR